MSTQPIVLIDCHGPLAEFTAGLCAELRGHGYARDESSILHWDLAFSLTKSEIDLVPRIVGAPGFPTSLRWVDGAADMVRALRHDGFDTVCVTSPWPCDTWEGETRRWLAPLFAADDVMFVRSSRKRMVRGDVLIEDHPGIACSWLRENPNGHAVLVDRPWNRPGAREYDVHHRMVRAADSADVLAAVRELA